LQANPPQNIVNVEVPSNIRARCNHEIATGAPSPVADAGGRAESCALAPIPLFYTGRPFC
jgi:hypothetical protein